MLGVDSKIVCRVNTLLFAPSLGHQIIAVRLYNVFKKIRLSHYIVEKVMRGVFREILSNVVGGIFLGGV